VRQLNKSEERLNVRTLPEIRDAFDRLLKHLQRDLKLKVQETRRQRKVETSHAINAVVCWLLTQDAKSQDAVIAEGMSILKDRLASDTPIPIDGAPPASAPEDPSPPRKRTGKGLSGHRHADKDRGERQDAAPVLDHHPKVRA
jgi:hypothetical protein